MRGSARRREAQRGGAAAAGADARPDRARATPVGAGHMQAAIGTPCANTRLQERRRQAEARVPAPQEGALADAGEAGVAPSAIPRAATPYPGRTTRSGAGTAPAAVTPGSHAPILPVAPPMPAVARTHDLPRQLDAAGGTQKRKPCDLRSVQGKIKRLTREISQSPYVAEPSFFDVAARGAFVVSTVGNGGFGECFKAVRMFGATSYSEACRFIQAMGGAAVDDGAGDAWHPLLERLVTHGEGALYVELAIKRIYEDSTAADVYNEVRHLRQLEGKPCIIPLWAEEGVWGGQEELVSKRRRLEAGQALERIKDQRDKGKRPDPADEACAEWVDAPCCSLVFPHFAHDSFRHLVRHAKLSDVQHYMLALLTALRGMHSLSVIHRDIKPSNFLYNMKLREGYLIDFGLAQTEAEALVRKLRKDKRKQPSQQHHGQAGGASKGKELVAGEGRLDPVSPVTRAQASRGKRQVEQAGVGKAVSGKLQLPQAPNASKPLHHNKRATRHLPEHNKDARRAAAQPKPQIRGTAYAQGGSGVAPRTVSGGRAGTRGFRAPEVLMRVKKQTTAVDMWAAGIMLMCLLSGRDYLLFGCSDDLDSLFEVRGVQHVCVMAPRRFALARMPRLARATTRDACICIPVLTDNLAHSCLATVHTLRPDAASRGRG